MLPRKAVLMALCLFPLPAMGAGLRYSQNVAATSPSAAAAWAQRVQTLMNQGDLRIVQVAPDPDFPGWQIQRMAQFSQGLPIFGAQLARRIDAGRNVGALFGQLDDRPAGATATLTGDQAVQALARLLPAGARILGEPALVWLPLEDRAALSYMLFSRVADPPSLKRHFVDAQTGLVVLEYEDLKTEAAVGIGTGIWADRKRMSTDRSGSTFTATDVLRPARITTYDMKYNLDAYDRMQWTGYEARDDDNDWTEASVVDAHVYAGYTYDYYYERFGRKGINNGNMPIISFVRVLGNYINAFWDSWSQSMTYGDGGSMGGMRYVPLCAAIDVVAHELTHGVTDNTWNGIYMNESGALNEAFSDIMGAAVEFFIEPAGYGRNKAEYFVGEDLTEVFSPEVYAFRSMENPRMFGDPDHYSIRYLGTQDGGGVHINSGIANQAFYLLVEGGTNRTSGRTVAGLGAANRAKAEHIFYRGFTQYLTPASNFSAARRATVLAAQELYGAGSTEQTQTAAAWDAVGVY
jgi:bacillolysin